MTSSRKVRAAVVGAALVVSPWAASACGNRSGSVQSEGVADTCAGDPECGQGRYCANGTCRPACTSNGECSPAEVCTEGRCTTPNGTGGSGSGGTGMGGTAVVIDPDSGTAGADAGLDPDAACATATATAMLVPVSMFVMFDRSTSMITEAVPTRWDNAVLALNAFFEDPGAAGLAVALRFFPHDEPAVGCTDSTCTVEACAQPLVPRMADPTEPLPTLTADPAPDDAHEAALGAAVVNSTPQPPGTGFTGGTPTHAALQGALDWATAYQAAHPYPEQQTVAVLVTDGDPNGCDRELDRIEVIAALAADALATSNIRTYVVGLTDQPRDLEFLEDLAEAGGTAPAFIVEDGTEAAEKLAATLREIQGSALACDFPYPTVEDGEVPDPTRINVDYTPGAPGAAPVELGQVETEAACLEQPGWYYDDNTMPTRIFLCPATCTTVRTDPNARLDIQIGCVTRPRDPA